MNEEEKFRLTEQGEARAVDIIGGQDIANTLGACLHIMKTTGNSFGTKITEKGEVLRLWLALVPILRLVKHCKNWDSFVVSCENMLEKEVPEWFKVNPHSDLWDDRIEK